MSGEATGAGALAGIRVVDLTDERAIYGAKLLADLGAEVLRPEPPDGDPLRRRGPFGRDEDGVEYSLWHAFFASNRRFFSVDPAQPGQLEQLLALIGAAQVLLVCDGGFCRGQLDLAALQQQHPALVIVDTSSFGPAGPWRDYLAPDLVAGALGGAVATTGDVDTPPLKTFGELNFMVAGAYVAIGALAALFAADATGRGQKAEISVHECIASCLEQVFMFYCYEHLLGREEGKVLPRRGALHWSDAYTVMNGKNGSIMVTPTPDFDAQLAWLIEEGVHDDLLDPKYQEPENLRLLILRVMEVLQNWVAGQDVEALFYAAQQRHAPYGWVQPLEKVAHNPQLEARNWYVPYRLGGLQTQAPGAPYRFSDTPWRLADYAEPSAVLADIGWESKP